MAAYFFDSSAIVKRYLQEAGTQWVRGMTRRDASHEIYVVRITAVEVTSAVARRRGGKKLTRSRAATILHRFRRHLAARYAVTEVTPGLAVAAMRLANKHALRAYDAVQLAAAIEVDRFYRAGGQGPVTFVCSDDDLNKAAVAEGMTVENPNNHP